MTTALITAIIIHNYVQLKQIAEKVSKRPQPAGGSRLGKPNKVTADIKAMIIGALDDCGGQAYLRLQAIENPVAFMGLLGKILPKDIKVEMDASMRITNVTHTIIDGTFEKDTTSL